MAGRSYQTEAVVLRSFRLGEADRVLHLYTLGEGRVGAVAKGIRKTKSRFGGRLEPLSHVQVALHRGSGELQTITGVELLRSHRDVRENYGRLAVGLIGAEAMLRLFVEEEANPRAFQALTRFLDALDQTTIAPGARPELNPLALAFQLKLLWVAGYLPHLTSCAECGTTGEPLVGYSPRAGGAVCRGCAGPSGAHALTAAGIEAIEELLRRPLAEAGAVHLAGRSAREALTVVTSSYEYHGGFRMRTLSA
jgi:DNA repair protein RecO (recombination protein O)